MSGNISDKKPIFASHADRMLYCGIVCKTHSLIGWQCSHDDDDHDDYSDDHDDDCNYDDVHHNDEIENTCPFLQMLSHVTYCLLALLIVEVPKCK